MKRLILVVTLAATGFLRAEDGGVFLSLTRSATPDKRLPTNVSRMTADDWESLGATALDEGVVPFPSVVVQKSGGAGSFATLRLRGSPSSAQQQILIDDLPLLGISNQFFDLSQMPLTDIDRIEVVRGGASVLYGANTTGGVVHLLTKRPVGDKPQTRLKSEFRSYYTQLYEGDIRHRVGGFDAYASAGRSLTDGFQKNADSDNLHGTLKTGYTFGSGARLAIDGAIVDGEVGNPHGTLLPVEEWDGKKEREAVDPTARVQQKAQRGHGLVFLPLGRSASVQSTFYGTGQRYETRPSKTAAPDFEQDNRFWGNDTRFQWSDVITLGAAYEWDGQKTAESAFAPARNNHITNVGAYGQLSLALGAWVFMPGLRYDSHSAFGPTWNPRLTVAWRATENLKLSGNAARSFRAPSFLELYYVDAFFSGNPDLRPEKAWSYDFGFEVGGNAARRLSVTGFYTKIEDRGTVNGAFTSYENAPQAELAGAEVESRHPLLPRVTGRASYTYTRAIGNSLTESTHRALRLTPRHAAFYQAAWRPGNEWELSSAVRYVSRQFQKDDQRGLDLPTFAVWGARLSKKILAAEFYVACDNILNRRYALTFDAESTFPFSTTRNPQPGRTFWMGTTIRFAD